MLKKAFISTLLAISFSLLYSQVNEDKLKVYMLYNIANYIIWPQNNNHSEFTIGFLGKNNTIRQELELIAGSKKISGKKIVIKAPEEILETDNLDLLFVTSQLDRNVPKIFQQAKENGILLITEFAGDNLYTMINFVKDESTNKISFEVNKQNIILSGFDYKPELLIFGGTEVDIKALYRATRKMLDKESENVLRLQEENKIKEIAIAENNSLILSLEKDIKSINDTLSSLTDSLTFLGKIIKQQKEEIQNSNDELLYKKIQYSEMEKEYISLSNTFDELNKKISIQTQRLQKLDEVISVREKIIKNQSITINQKDELILAERKILYLVSMSGLALLAIGMLIFRAFRLKRKYNLLLETKVEELSLANEQLASQKEEMEATLEELDDTRLMLIRSERLSSLGVFTAGIAHEINNPINFISSGTTALFEIIEALESEIGRDNPSLSGKFEEIDITKNAIQTGIERTTSIISSLRNYSRTSDTKFITYNVINCINDTLILLHSNYKYHITINKELPEILEVECMPGRISQLFVNIINNAIQAIEKDGLIKIKGKKLDQKAVFEISDNGCGVEKEILDKIFDPFFTTKEVGKGTGLGLYLVHGIIEEHNGFIEVSSIPGEGTRFIITLPLHQTALVE